tara:strand:+ start:51 stop:494 length:444 start_codon:yes stop_codon:yes gene_type:complete
MTSINDDDPIRFLGWSSRRAARKTIKEELKEVANNDNQRRKLEFVLSVLKLKGKLIHFCNKKPKNVSRDERLRACDALLEDFAEKEDVSRTSLHKMLRLIGLNMKTWTVVGGQTLRAQLKNSNRRESKLCLKTFRWAKLSMMKSGDE